MRLMRSAHTQAAHRIRQIAIAAAIALVTSIIAPAAPALAAPRTIAGTVSFADGGTAAGAEVHVYHSGGWLDVVPFVQTDGQGAYSVSVPDTETVVLVAVPSGTDTTHGSTPPSAAITAGSSAAQVNLQLPVAQQFVQLNLPNGSGAAHGYVRLWKAFGTLDSVVVANAVGRAGISASGRFWADAVPPNDDARHDLMVAWINGPTNNSYALPIGAPGTAGTTEIVTFAAGTIFARLVDSQGKSANESTLGDLVIAPVNQLRAPCSLQAKDLRNIGRPDGWFATTCEQGGNPYAGDVAIVGVPDPNRTDLAPAATVARTLVAGAPVELGALPAQSVLQTGTISTGSKAVSGQPVLWLQESGTATAAGLTMLSLRQAAAGGSPWSYTAHLKPSTTYNLVFMDFISTHVMSWPQGATLVTTSAATETVNLNWGTPGAFVTATVNGQSAAGNFMAVRYYGNAGLIRPSLFDVIDRDGHVFAWLQTINPFDGSVLPSLSALQFYSSDFGQFAFTPQVDLSTNPTAYANYVWDINLVNVSGTITRSNGSPAGNAIVEIDSLVNPAINRWLTVGILTTAADGAYSLSVVATSSSQLRLRVDPHNNVDGAVATDWFGVDTRTSITRNVQLQPANVIVTVQADTPTFTNQDVSVTAQLCSSTCLWMGSALMDSTSHKSYFTLPVGAPAVVRAYPYPSGGLKDFIPTSTNFTVPNSDVYNATLTLVRGATISGKVTGATGAAVPYAQMQCRYTDTATPGTQFGCNGAMTGADGSYSLLVEPASGRVFTLTVQPASGTDGVEAVSIGEVTGSLTRDIQLHAANVIVPVGVGNASTPPPANSVDVGLDGCALNSCSWIGNSPPRSDGSAYFYVTPGISVAAHVFPYPTGPLSAYTRVDTTRFTVPDTGTLSLPVILQLGNISGQLYDVNGAALSIVNFWVDLQVQRRDAWGNWIYVSTASLRQDGTFTARTGGEGVYRVYGTPFQNPNLAPSASACFYSDANGQVAPLATCDSTPGALSAAIRLSITMQAPNLRGLIVRPDSGTAVTNAWVELRRANVGGGTTWVSSIGTGGTGGFGLNITDDGNYTLTVNPPGDGSLSQFTSKTYSFAVTGGVAGAISPAVTKSGGVYTLPLGVPNLQGTVTFNGSPVPQAWVGLLSVALDGSQTWLRGVSTDARGRFAFAIDRAGSYALTVDPPNGQAAYATAAAARYAFTAVDSGSGITSTLTGGGSFDNLALRAANVTGRILDRSGRPIPSDGTGNACVNLQRYNSSTAWWEYTGTGRCTDANGYFSLAVSDAGTYRLAVSLWNHPDLAGFNTDSFTATGKAFGDLVAPAPNLRIKALNVNGAATRDVWVELFQKVNGNLVWQQGANTDANGLASMNITTPGSYQVALNPPWSSPDAGARKTYNVTVTDALAVQVEAQTAVSGTYALSLAVANFQGTVALADTSTGITSWTWLEASTQDAWFGGVNVNPTSPRFAMSLTSGAGGTPVTYTVRLHPGSTDIGAGYGMRSYTVTVENIGGVDTVTAVAPLSLDGTAQSPIAAGANGYGLLLAPANVKGVVYGADGSGGSVPIANSWVVPMKGGQELWQYGFNSSQLGLFLLSLRDDTYDLKARSPWNNSGYADSALCRVNVVGGVATVTTTDGSCTQNASSKLIALNLRAPNFHVHVTLPDGSTPVKDSWVWLNAGAWGQGANTDSKGDAAFFIDPQEVRNVSGWSGPFQIRVWANVPWDMQATYSLTTIVSGSAQFPDIALDATTYTVDSVTVALQAANVPVHVLRSNGLPATNSWVELYQVSPDGTWLQWITGSNVRSDGIARFSVPSSSTERYVLHVWPNGAAESTDGDTWFTGKSTLPNYPSSLSDSMTATQLIAGVTINLIPAAVTGTVTNVAGTGPNAYARVTVNRCNGSNCWQVRDVWTNGAGQFALNLESLEGSSDSYTITAYPAAGASGAAVTSAAFRIDNAHPTINVPLRLNLGNVVGRVLLPGGASPAVGAFVIVTETGTAGTPRTYTTTTDSDGRFGFNLDPGTTWDFAVIRTDLAAGTPSRQTAWTAVAVVDFVTLTDWTLQP